jgi:hypothetical protein
VYSSGSKNNVTVNQTDNHKANTRRTEVHNKHQRYDKKETGVHKTQWGGSATTESQHELDEV